jgi:hypothetical protein
VLYIIADKYLFRTVFTLLNGFFSLLKEHKLMFFILNGVDMRVCSLKEMQLCTGSFPMRFAAIATLVVLIISVTFEVKAEPKLQDTLAVMSADFEMPAVFNVTLPPSYFKEKNKRYVVLVDFHPRSHAYLSGLHDWMSHNGEWPWLETIIITAPNGHKGLGQLKTVHAKKKGKRLLDFIEKDLLATIDKNYRTNGFRILSGFRGNASLSLYTLLHRPELFNAYFVASPLLDDDYMGLISDAPKLLPKLKGKPRFLFLSSGNSSFEQRDQADFSQLKKIIAAKAPKELDWRVKRFDDSFYMSQPALASIYAIEALFLDFHQALAPDSEISSQGVNAIIKHYRYLSEQKYGFEVSAQDALIALAKSQISNNPEQAFAIFNRVVALYPDSASAYDSFAAAYAEQGQYHQAVTLQAKALAKTTHPFNKQRYRLKLQEYQAKLPQS